MKKRPFNLQVRAQADGDFEISVRGVIGKYFDPDNWSMSDTETDVLNELNKIPAGKKINVRVNSIGGVVQYGLGIYNALARRKADVTTYNDGFACSAAAIVMLAGNRRVSPPASMMMIHNAAGGGEGTAKDMRSIADCLDTLDEVQATTLASISGKKTKAEFAAMLDATTWMTGEKAVDLGLATECAGEIEEDEPDAETAKAELEILEGYKNGPEQFQNLRSRLAMRAQAVLPPPTNQPQPTKKSMKLIIAALMAAGLTVPPTAEENEILSHLNPLLAENKRLKTEVEAHATARKTRVTAALDAAVTDKVLADTRKPGLLALGIASADGETEVLAQIGELRAAKTPVTARGVKPAKPGPVEDDAEAQSEARLEEIHAELAGKNITAAKRSELTAESLKIRGLNNLFRKPATATAAAV